MRHNQFKHGTNTIISDNASHFGGQLQRICLARLFIFKRNLIISDEATNALDKV